MSQLNLLFQDSYFWLEMGLFLASLLGAILILRSLQKEPSPKPLVSKSLTPSKDKLTYKGAMGKEGAYPNPHHLSEGHISNENKKITFETLSERIGQVERIVSEIDHKLDQLAVSQKEELPLNVQTMLQNLKSKEKIEENERLNQLSLKVDRIYQILEKLFSTEKK